MLPTTQSPVLIPMPTAIVFLPSAASSSLSFCMARPIAIAAWTANFACSGWSVGAFQNAIMQSPIYLSMVPSVSKISSERTESNLLINWVNPSGSSLYCSEMPVNPRISENSMVISLVSPPRTNDSLDFASLSTMAGARYWENAVLTLLRSSSVNKKLKNVITR